MTLEITHQPVQLVHAPQCSRGLAEPHAGRRVEATASTPVDLDAAAAETVSRALAMLKRVRAAGVSPDPAARATAGYLTTAVLYVPGLDAWRGEP